MTITATDLLAAAARRCRELAEWSARRRDERAAVGLETEYHTGLYDAFSISAESLERDLDMLLDLEDARATRAIERMRRAIRELPIGEAFDPQPAINRARS